MISSVCSNSSSPPSSSSSSSSSPIQNDWADVFSAYILDDPHNDVSMSGYRGRKARKRALGRELAGKETEQRGSAAKLEQFDDEVMFSRPTRFWLDRVDRARIVDVRDITLTIGDDNRTLLDGGDLKLFYGHRYGLVGDNGVGKSTLMHRIARGLLLNWPTHMSAMYVCQEIIGDHRSAIEIVQHCDPEHSRLNAEEAKLLVALEKGQGNLEKLEQKLADIHARMDEVGVFTAAARASQVLSELGFTQRLRSCPSQELSGGWRMRLALARAMFINPDVLMLDEPTNHMDLEAIVWLQHYLLEKFSKDSDSILVVVSHDRNFLSTLCTDTIIWSAESKKLIYHAGDYDSFVKRSQEMYEKEAKLYDWQERKKAHMEKSIQRAKQQMKKHKLGDRGGSAAGMVRSREKAIDRLGDQRTLDGKKWKWSIMGNRRKIEDPSKMLKTNKGFYFQFPTPTGLTSGSSDIPLIHVSNLSYGFETQTDNFSSSKKSASSSSNKTNASSSSNKTSASSSSNKTNQLVLFENANLVVTSNARIAILGPNGSGKTSFLECLVGRRRSTNPKGRVRFRSHQVRMAFYAQHHIDALGDLSSTPMEQLRALYPATTKEMQESDLRKHMGRFGLHGETALAPFTQLSGGQRARAVWALIMFGEPHVIVMDEPTNHLDLDTIEALENAIEMFEGAVVMVSHDARLLSRAAKELYVIHDKQLKRYDGTFDEYQKELLAAIRAKQRRREERQRLREQQKQKEREMAQRKAKQEERKKQKQAMIERNQAKLASTPNKRFVYTS